MAKTNKGRKLFATTATAALVASAIVPVASAAEVNDINSVASYAKDAVQDLVDRGVIEGDAKGNFNPRNSVTRAEAATIFAKALDLESTGTINFSDVKSGAWYYDAIAAAVNNGIFQGQSASNFNPSGNLTRSEAAIIYVNAFGLEGSDDLSSFKDASAVKAWAKEAIQIAVANGVLKGDDKGNLNPNANITKQDFAVMFARAEAAVVDPAADLKEALETLKTTSEKLAEKVTAENVAAAKTAVADAKEAITAVEEALKAAQEAKVVTEEEVKATEEAITAAKAALEKAEKAVAGYEESLTVAKVESVSATNLKEIVVTFNQAVNKTTAENKDAYVVKKGLSVIAIDSAQLQADGKTVILTVNTVAPNTALTNQSKEYTLSLDGIKAGEKVISAKDVAFTPLDQALPTVESVTGLGNKAVKVTFSEPVKLNSTVASAFKIDDKVVSGVATVTGRTVTIELFSTLTDGKHDLTVNNNIIDYTNYQLVETTKSFEVVADTTAPTITEVKDATLEGVTVVFSEDIKKAEAETAANYHWMSGSTKKVASKATLINSNTVRVSFSANPLPGYTTDLFVNNISDYSGNKLAKDSKVAVTAQLDQVRPEVLTSKYDNSTKQLTVTFSKEVKLASFKASNVVVKDKDGKVVSNGYSAALNDGNKLTVTFTNALKPGNYSFELSGVTDTTLLANSMLPYTTQLAVTNTTAPKATGITGTGTTYVVSFDKAMDQSSTASILNPDNYFVTYKTTDTPERTVNGKLPAGTNLSPTSDGKGVIVTFPTGVKALTSFTVQGVKDTDGNFISGYAQTFTTFEGNAKLVKAVATSTTKVELTMNQPMGYVNAADFLINGAAVKSAEIKSTDNKVVVLTLNTAVAAHATPTVSINPTLATTNPTVGLTNAPVLASDSVVATDGIAPVVKINATTEKITVDNTLDGDAGIEVASDKTDFTLGKNRIVVNFNEAVQAVNPSKLDDNFNVYRADGTPIEFGIDYEVTISSGAVVIDLFKTGKNLAGFDGKLQLVFDNTNENIIDGEENVAKGFDTAVDVADGTSGKDLIKFEASPTLLSAKLVEVAGTGTAGTGELGEKVELTFSEDLAVPTTLSDLSDDFTAAFGTGATFEVSGSKVTVTLGTSPTITKGTSTVTVTSTAANVTLTDIGGNKAIPGTAVTIN
ncbi:S-layer homology domain-containing protein [Solibacillus sp.]|uniref:S-layer homology domain-containing protein n=1 Tax=Solibacillus sp. TaxID=1909654 RepID=UPI003315D178